MGPIDYRLNLPDPTQAVMGAAQGMGQLLTQQRNAQWAQQDRTQAMADAETQRQAAQAQQKALFDLSRDPTPENITRTMVRYPGLAKELQMAHQGATEEQRDAAVRTLAPLYTALQNKNYDVAKELMIQDRNAAKNAGDKRRAGIIDTQLFMLDTNPDQVTASVGMSLNAAAGADKFASMYKTGAEVQKTGAEIGEIQAKTKEIPLAGKATRQLQGAQASEAAAKAADIPRRFALDKDTFVTNTQLKLEELGIKKGELPAGAEKLVNEAAGESVAASQTGARMLDLANQFTKEIDTLGNTPGLRTVGAWLDRQLGEQHQLSKLRQEYARLKNNVAIQSLPKGSASDRDVQIAMQGFPGENAPAQQIAAFLRGTAKLAQLDAVTADAKTEWGSKVKSLGNSRGDLEIMGIKVPAGTSFPAFIKANAPALAAKAFAEHDTAALAAKYGAGPQQ